MNYNAARPKATNGTGYWTRTMDISKTGVRGIRGDRILRALRRRTVGFAGTVRLTSGPALILSFPCRLSVFTLSLKS